MSEFVRELHEQADAPTRDVSEGEERRGRPTFEYTPAEKDWVKFIDDKDHREGLAAMKASQEAMVWDGHAPSPEFEKRNSSYSLLRPDVWVVEGGEAARDRMFASIVESLLTHGVPYFLDPGMPEDARAHYQMIIGTVERKIGVSSEDVALKEAHDKLDL